MSQRRVVVTGLGILTSCGNGWKPYWQSVLKQKSHIRSLPDVYADSFPAKLAGYIADFDPAKFIKQRKLIKVMSREIQLALAASSLALEDASLETAMYDPFRFGICIGTGIINNDLDEVGLGIRNALDDEGCFQMKKFGQEGIRSLYPLWLLKYLPNMPACHISIAHCLKGPSNTLTTSSAAGTQAIGEAFRVIKRGDADLMLAGGTDSKLNPMGIARFNLLGFLSFQQDAPEKAYCPFDERRDGVILGEGSGLLVLEDFEHARKRGARIYGEVLGYGTSSDFNYDPRSSEDMTGKCLAMTRALEDASTDVSEIDFLLANGSGIPHEDINEANAVHSVFGKHVGQVQVTAVKPVSGHSVYASGGIEIAAGLASLNEGVIPAVTNLEKPDRACDLPFVVGENQTHPSRVFLFNSFGFGGQNASLVVRKI